MNGLLCNLPIPKFTLILFFLLMFFSACQEEKQITTPQVSTQSSTEEMVKTLKNIDENAKKNVVGYGDNESMILKLQQQKSQAKGTKSIEVGFQLAAAYLRAGKTTAAVSEYEGIRNFLETNNLQLPTEQQVIILKSLALSYLRLGEEQNCTNTREPSACILPLSKAAQYKMTQGSKAAIGLYKEVLQLNPQDKSAQYLLNLAAMTIGEYPDGVPVNFRLAEDVFQSDIKFPSFKNIAAEAGVNTIGLSGGVVAEDLDNDGDIDLAVSSWGTDNQLRILLNDGKGKFTDKTTESGLTGITGGLNLIHADYDNDGDSDILVLRGAWYGKNGLMPNSLLRNNGDATFEDVTIQAGIYSLHPTQTASWVDFNADGHLDLFIGNETKNPKKPHNNELFINNKNGTFTNQISNTNISQTAFVKGVTSKDINQDGLPDLYISCYGQPNLLYLNQSKNNQLAFRDISKEAGVQQPMYSFPAWFFDYDNDGDVDLFVSGYGQGKTSVMAEEVAKDFFGEKTKKGQPKLYENTGIENGIPVFKDKTAAAGLDAVLMTMGSNYGDLNNDGYLDFYLGTGTPEYESVFPNRMYLNQGGKKFTDVTYAGGFGLIQKGHGVAFADFDNDGDQDIYSVTGGAYKGDISQNVLFENPEKNAQNFIKLRLEGTTANRSAIGTQVIVEVLNNGQKRNIYRTVSTGGSFGGNPLNLHIGIGEAEKVEKLTLIWSDRAQSQQVFENVEKGALYKLKQGGDMVKIVDSLIG